MKIQIFYHNLFFKKNIVNDFGLQFWKKFQKLLTELVDGQIGV